MNWHKRIQQKAQTATHKDVKPCVVCGAEVRRGLRSAAEWGIVKRCVGCRWKKITEFRFQKFTPENHRHF